MRYKPLNIAATADFLSRRRPALESVIRKTQPLFELRKDIASELEPVFKASGVALPDFEPQRAREGEALLAGMELAALLPALRYAAEKALPALQKLPPLAKRGEALEALFLGDQAEAFFEAMMGGDERGLMDIGRKLDIPLEILLFAGEFILSPVLRALVKLAEPAEGDFPWNEEGAWSQGYCPVCGDLPALAWLDRPRADLSENFLVSGGGKKNYYCSLCGAGWKFRRSHCPSCGREGNNVLEILREKGADGERVDFCVHCKSYCPTVDLREFGDVPDMDVMALGMLHMDIAASQKNLRPLKPSFWNVF